MRPGRLLARAHGLDDAGWARHANPWSVWTRVPLLALFALAIWSRAWIGAWALVPVVALVLWTWANPRAFPPPARTDTWSARGAMGERVWLNRDAVPIPAHHARVALLTSALGLAGLPFLAYGLWALEPWPTIFGVTLGMLGKLWFCDRMVWLYDDMSARHPKYRDWAR